MSTSFIPDKISLHKKCTNLVQMRLYDELGKAYLDNTATVNVVVYDCMGNTIANSAIALTHDLNSNTGDFSGLIPATFDPPEGTGYIFLIMAQQGAAQLYWPIPCEVLC